jgi:hypothetical protein
MGDSLKRQGVVGVGHFLTAPTNSWDNLPNSGD